MVIRNLQCTAIDLRPTTVCKYACIMTSQSCQAVVDHTKRVITLPYSKTAIFRERPSEGVDTKLNPVSPLKI